MPANNVATRGLERLLIPRHAGTRHGLAAYTNRRDTEVRRCDDRLISSFLRGREGQIYVQSIGQSGLYPRAERSIFHDVRQVAWICSIEGQQRQPFDLNAPVTLEHAREAVKQLELLFGISPGAFTARAELIEHEQVQAELMTATAVLVSRLMRSTARSPTKKRTDFTQPPSPLRHVACC